MLVDNNKKLKKRKKRAERAENEQPLLDGRSLMTNPWRVCQQVDVRKSMKLQAKVERAPTRAEMEFGLHEESSR